MIPTVTPNLIKWSAIHVSFASASSQDDANNDPQWSEEQLLAAGFEPAGVTIGRCEVDIMSKSTVAIFEVLEKAWATQNCTLVDMKVL